MKVALDAGHGATSRRPYTGASANGLVEDELALDFITRIGHHLRAAGHQTLYTRPDERLVSLSKRGALAKRRDCDLFLSIHCNAGPTHAQGVEAFVANRDYRSQRIARKIVEAVSMQGLKSRGTKWDSQSQHSRLRVLRDTYRHMPAVLIELGFLTNPEDVAKLKSRFFREAVSIAIAEAIGAA